MWTLLSILGLVLPPPNSTSTARAAASEVLEQALVEAQDARTAGRGPRPVLETAIERARGTLGAGSEVARELGRLSRGADFEAFFADDDGADWLAARLAGVVSDLRFEPRIEADVPAGFPGWTPVGEIAVQHYPAYRMARTDMGGARGQGAFWKLFGHIQSEGIAMTAPVETAFSGAGAADEASMAFLYASTDLGRTGARGAVEVVDVPPQSAVSLGLRGRESSERIADARRRLQRWLDEQSEWRADGPLRTMSYNSPMVRGDQRYFEVQIPVVRVPSATPGSHAPRAAQR